MFTLTAALGSVELSHHGVLVTRLSALHDFASVTVFCTDKTGTLTRNESTVGALWAAPGSSDDEVLRTAAMASDPSGQDPVDGAIVSAATKGGWRPETNRINFILSIQQPSGPRAFTRSTAWSGATSKALPRLLPLSATRMTSFGNPKPKE